jgi:acyl-coenzyme A thioesterase PaaI-like protein
MDVAQIKYFAEESIGIVKQMGVKLLEIEPRRVVMQMPLKPENVNHFQTMYAGVQFTLAEVMGGALMMAH